MTSTLREDASTLAIKYEKLLSSVAYERKHSSRHILDLKKKSYQVELERLKNLQCLMDPDTKRFYEDLAPKKPLNHLQENLELDEMEPDEADEKLKIAEKEIDEMEKKIQLLRSGNE